VGYGWKPRRVIANWQTAQDPFVVALFCISQTHRAQPKRISNHRHKAEFISDHSFFYLASILPAVA